MYLMEKVMEIYNMDKMCTTIEQSQKLLELGIDVNTSDMYWSLVNKNNPPIVGKYCAEYGGMQLPAWSLSALLELMPKRITYCDCAWSAILIPINNEQWCCKLFSIELDVNVGFIEYTAVDAAFKMVCWLKENGKL